MSKVVEVMVRDGKEVENEGRSWGILYPRMSRALLVRDFHFVATFEVLFLV